MIDWTTDPETHRANSSEEFLRIRKEVGKLIRRSAHDLIGGRSDDVAGLIVAHLAHKHGYGPGWKPGRQRLGPISILPADTTDEELDAFLEAVEALRKGNK